MDTNTNTNKTEAFGSNCVESGFVLPPRDTPAGQPALPVTPGGSPVTPQHRVTCLRPVKVHRFIRFASIPGTMTSTLTSSLYTGPDGVSEKYFVFFFPAVMKIL
ncbi:hypothetical protein E2C01_094797 [Portunus trituberculatus]|uniref:Uncharacterized protein n=1 Tax=Portunus trituberculatus TaxID=210409 RepID=A0A5B7JYL6_PORTR|nr:hypothetical protein [Portunus trituberculatus]